MDDACDFLEHAWEAEKAYDLAGAERHYEKCLALAPDFARAWLTYGAMLLKLRRFDEALQALEHAENSPDERRHAYFISGQVYFEQNMWPEAEQAFRSSLALQRTTYAHVYLGVTLANAKRSTEAIESYKAALEIDPNFDEAHYNLGVEYHIAKDDNNAVLHFRRAIAIDPNYGIAYAQLGKLLGGLAHKNEDKLREARHLLETATHFEPNDGWSRLYLANLCWRLCDNRAAERHYIAAIKILPTLGITHQCYAEFLAAKSDDRELMRFHVDRAIELDPQKAGWVYRLGSRLMRWHRRGEAEYYLKRAHELGYTTAKVVLDRLDEYIPKQDHWQICAECGTPLEPRNKWWCSECGTDLRIKKCQERYEYRSIKREYAQQFETLLPR